MTKIFTGHSKVAEMIGGAEALRNSDNLQAIPATRARAANKALDAWNWTPVGDAARPIVQAVIARQESDE